MSSDVVWRKLLQNQLPQHHKSAISKATKPSYKWGCNHASGVASLSSKTPPPSRLRQIFGHPRHRGIGKTQQTPWVQQVECGDSRRDQEQLQLEGSGWKFVELRFSMLQKLTPSWCFCSTCFFLENMSVKCGGDFFLAGRTSEGWL